MQLSRISVQSLASKKKKNKLCLFPVGYISVYTKTGHEFSYFLKCESNTRMLIQPLTLFRVACDQKYITHAHLFQDWAKRVTRILDSFFYNEKESE